MRNNTILKELMADHPDEPVPVRSVVIGAHWTAVCSRSCGLATTVPSD